VLGEGGLVGQGIGLAAVVEVAAAHTGELGAMAATSDVAAPCPRVL
jgi:hypothetical protein